MLGDVGLGAKLSWAVGMAELRKLDRLLALLIVRVLRDNGGRSGVFCVSEGGRLAPSNVFVLTGPVLNLRDRKDGADDEDGMVEARPRPALPDTCEVASPFADICDPTPSL